MDMLLTRGGMSSKMKTSLRRMRSDNLHLAVHGITTTTLSHLHD
jgi:hypothetical protein